MMLYVINGEDVPNSLEKRMAVRPEHLKRIQALQEEGRLILAGPYPAIDSHDPGAAGFSGSLIFVVETKIGTTRVRSILRPSQSRPSRMRKRRWP